jgi:hypothetical protein
VEIHTAYAALLQRIAKDQRPIMIDTLNSFA